MTLFLIELLAVALIGIKFSFRNGFDDYAGKDSTNSVKGIFVAIVVLSHVRQYITVPSSAINEPYIFFMHHLEQLMVVMFLFYSGYGIALSIAKKPGYIKTLPVKRALKVYVHFLFALLAFFILSLILGKGYDYQRVLLSMVGLSGLGNSSWFIFVILLLYLATWLAFKVCREKMVPGLIAVTVLSAVLTVLIYLFKGEENHWWYDTIMTYPLGMWFYLGKPAIDRNILKKPIVWTAVTAASVALFAVLAYLTEKAGRPRSLFIPESLVFAVMVVLLTMRIRMDNTALRWLGKRVFGIYMLQRIPMIFIHDTGLCPNPYGFTAIAIISAFIIAEIFDRSMDVFDRLVGFSKPKVKKLPDSNPEK